MSETPGSIELCDEQKAAVDTILSTPKKVIILTGAAGSGKSTVINELRKDPHKFSICATTGRAALLIGGVTVDSVFCFNRDNWRVWNDSLLAKNMANTGDCIIIDEASAVGLHMANTVNESADDFNKQILLVGDWAQTRPVKDEWILESRLLEDFEFIKLQENHRQAEGPYLDVLNEFRNGIVSEQGADLMKSRVNPMMPADDSWLRMFATNRTTNQYNEARLSDHIEENRFRFRPFYLEAEFVDERADFMKKKYPRNYGFIQDKLDASNFAHQGDRFALGCRVLITMNSPMRDFVNGDTGTIVEIHTLGKKYTLEDPPPEGTPYLATTVFTVLRDRGHRLVPVPRMSRTVEDARGFKQHTIHGWPMRLGYALTIHKSQGMTVNKAWVDLSSTMHFPDDAARHGLAYVALSRTRTIDGLLINSWVPEAIYCDPTIRGLL